MRCCKMLRASASQAGPSSALQAHASVPWWGCARARPRPQAASPESRDPEDASAAPFARSPRPSSASCELAETASQGEQRAEGAPPPPPLGASCAAHDWPRQRPRGLDLINPSRHEKQEVANRNTFNVRHRPVFGRASKLCLRTSSMKGAREPIASSQRSSKRTELIRNPKPGPVLPEPAPFQAAPFQAGAMQNQCGPAPLSAPGSRPGCLAQCTQHGHLAR